MTARELLLLEDRMAREDEDTYSVYAFLLWKGDRKGDEAIALAEKWAREHPEEKDKE